MSGECLAATALELRLEGQVRINCWDWEYRGRNSIRSWLEWEVEDLVQMGHACGALQSGVRAGEGVTCEGMEGVPLGFL